MLVDLKGANNPGCFLLVEQNQLLVSVRGVFLLREAQYLRGIVLMVTQTLIRS